MKMTNADERKRQIEERRAKTYHGHALHTDEDIYGGRFATINTTTVVGTKPTVEYPAMPDGPWKSEPIGTEAPLGYSVEDQEPVGETFEVAASQTGETATPAPPPGHVITSGGGAGFKRRF
jgi:hypothetical protein